MSTVSRDHSAHAYLWQPYHTFQLIYPRTGSLEGAGESAYPNGHYRLHKGWHPFTGTSYSWTLYQTLPAYADAYSLWISSGVFYSPYEDSSVDSLKDLLTSVFQQQFHDLGWENFLRGRISKLWSEVWAQTCICHHQHVDKQLWTASVVRALLQYSHSL
jgi:hypothetical protein